MRIFIIIGVLGVLVSSCKYNYEVDTWDDWCDDQIRKNAQEKHNATTVSYDYKSIRDDFIDEYNQILADDIINYHFIPGAESDEDVRDMIDNHEIGIWREGDILHLSEYQCKHEEFTESCHRLNQYLNFDDLKNNTYKLSDHQVCIYKTIDAMFEKLVVHGIDEKESIELDFTFRKQIRH